VEDARVAGEHLLDVLGVGQNDPRSLARNLEPKHISEASGALGQQPLGAPDPDRRLERGGHPRTGREFGYHAVCKSDTERYVKPDP
jgi:hypothetical protein